MPKHSRDSIREQLIGLGETSARKNYYPELRQSARQVELVRTLLDSAGDGIFVVDAATLTIIDINQTACTLLGITGPRPIGGHLPTCVPYLNIPALREGQPTVVERQTTSGCMYLELAVSHHAFAGTAYVSCIARDVSARIAAERQLAQSETRYRTLFEAAGEAILLLRDDAIVDCNRKTEVLFGRNRQELLGLSLGDITSGSAGKGNCAGMMCADTIQTGIAQIPQRFLWEMFRKDGSPFLAEVALDRVTMNEGVLLLILLRDVTEQQRMREVMIQTEKMMSVGGLAAGMAHEINNPLSIIAQAAQNLQRRIAPDLPANQRAAQEAGIDLAQMNTYLVARGIPALAGNISEACHRAATIVRNMLDFSRRSNRDRSSCDLRDMADKVIDLAASDYDLKKKYDFKSIRIIRDYADELDLIPCVRTDIEQVLFNLIRNASEALSDKQWQGEERPTIRISVQQEVQAIRIEVEDNGPGMTEEVRRRIFEPFFTTKPPGSGTGLGLSVSYFIVCRNHGGELWVESQPGGWTRFIIRLPQQANQPQFAENTLDG